MVEEVEKVRRHCQQSKMRFVKGDAPTCLPGTVLRQMVKTFKLKAESDDPKHVDAFRPYSKKGGFDGHNNHTTKAGLLKTVKETLDNLPEETWIVPEVKPKNKYLQSLKSVYWQNGRDSMVEKISRNYFKPMITDKNFNESWLHTTEIQDAILNATRRNRSFGFLGVARPTETGTEHLMLALKRMGGNGAKKVFGVVWNTSSSDHGSHWVSALIYPRQSVIEYFDSMGKEPPSNVHEQMRHLTYSPHGFFKNEWDMHTNTIKHQKGVSQCGMYSIWFIVQRIVEKRSFKDICETVTPDSEVCKLRSQYFFKPNKLIRRALDKERREMEVSFKKKRSPSRGNRYNPIVISPDRGNRDKPIELD